MYTNTSQIAVRFVSRKKVAKYDVEKEENHGASN